MRPFPLLWFVPVVPLLVTPGLSVAQTPEAPVRAALTLPMPGIETFHPVTTTVAIGSSASPEAMPTLRKAGFETLISVRMDEEEGYDRPAVEAAAVAAGLKFVSVPFNRAAPDPAAVQRFLEVMASEDTGAAYVFCHSGQRVAALWAIKRVKQDGWSLERALHEAESLGLTRPELKQFATRFVAGGEK